ncbi:MAG: hypothetical protein E7H57_15275 [Pantoea sp.]|nr:hypothetical protein [Pantoea sp.]
MFMGDLLNRFYYEALAAGRAGLIISIERTARSTSPALADTLVSFFSGMKSASGSQQAEGQAPMIKPFDLIGNSLNNVVRHTDFPFTIKPQPGS